MSRRAAKSLLRGVGIAERAENGRWFVRTELLRGAAAGRVRAPAGASVAPCYGARDLVGVPPPAPGASLCESELLGSWLIFHGRLTAEPLCGQPTHLLTFTSC